MATSPTAIHLLLHRIDEYRQKYYQSQLLKGALVSVALLLTLFLVVNTLEYFGRFNSFIRGGLLFGYLAVFAYALYTWVLRPLIHLAGLRKPITDEDAALRIGKHFPDIGDKLLNTLQLNTLSGKDSDLIEASIRQKSDQLLIVKFSDAIRFGENNKYVKYAAYPVAAVGMILLFNPSFFSSSSERILHFNTHFTYAPFSFHLENQSMKGFRNEDFTVRLKLEGKALPQAVYLVLNGTRFKLNAEDERIHTYTFRNLQKDLLFHFEAAGFQSSPYKIQVVERPGMLSFDVDLHYPSYLGKPSQSLSNVGNLTVPEGTSVEWRFKTSATRQLGLRFDGDSLVSYAQTSGSGNRFRLGKTVRRSSAYQLLLSNEEIPDGEALNYLINVIPDKHPELSVENFQDTTLYNYLIAGGAISDDYGFTRLSLFYSIHRDGSREEHKAPESLEIPFNKQANTQSFYFQWYVDSLKLKPGDRLEYYTQVWDNDGVNGPKSARSRTLSFVIPSKSTIDAEIEKTVEETKEQIEKSLEKAKSLERDIRNLENRIKANNELDFQERKQAEDLLRKREELVKDIQSLLEKNRLSNDKSRQFDQQSSSMQQKMDELQKLMNELLRDDSDKLYEELQKLLEQKQSERMTNMLEQLRNRERNREKELERTLNLFKKLQMEQKMEAVVEKLEELSEKQESLAEKTQKESSQEKKGNKEPEKKDDAQKDESSGSQDNNLLKEQEDIREDFEDIRKELEKIGQMGEELNQKPDLQENEQNAVEKEINNSRQQLRQKENQKAADSQKKAAKSMRNMAGSIQQEMENSMSMELQENIDSLRDILENLLKLSFDQEQLMKDFRGVSLSDPRFVSLGQQQLKLQDDARIIEDSLYALANRVQQIQSFVTRELGNMKLYMDASVQSIKDRRLALITSRQQFAMTSMNNLALMLSDVFRQMQQAMAAMMPGGQGKSGEKEGGMSPGELQKMLNSKMQQMGKGENGAGRSMSEELARMAAEQAAIREMVQKLMNDSKGTSFGEQYGKELKEILEQMDKSETEIVNKRVNQELIKRNEEMVTRLLESEKAQREQGEEEKRKGETARQLMRPPPPAFEEYIRAKEQQTELLRTVPAHFTPFYKRETDAYFQKHPGSG